MKAAIARAEASSLSSPVSTFEGSHKPRAGLRMTTRSRLRNVVSLLLLCAMVAGCHRNLIKNIPLAALGVKDRSSDFANIFCSLISTEKRPDGSNWGSCSGWLDNPQPRAVSLANKIDSTYRFLLIAGYGSDCLSGPHATFMDAIDHLQSVHSFTAETLPVSAFGSSEFNAKQIAAYLNSQFVSDQRKYIVLGYSKGMADLQVALADEPGVQGKVAALVTLSGTVQGSRLASIPDVTSQAALKKELLTCTPGDGGGPQSMSPAVRKAFLANHPNPLVPTYSVAAYSTRQNTSNVLLPTWDLIAQFGNVEDSLMIAGDAIYPRGSYLGLLKRDHWAIAIPFENSALINKNDFPRPQLFEAILRFVIADLNGTMP
jgi:hypothetical protein